MRKLHMLNEGEIEVEVKEEGIQISEREYMAMLVEEINNKTLNIVGGFNEELVNKVATFSNNLWYSEQDEERPLVINITSYGGSLDCLMAILDILQDLKETWDCKIITCCKGYAMSCGSILWLFGDERYMGEFGEVMIHQLSYGCGGQIPDHEFELKRSKKAMKKINKIITKKSPLTEKQLKLWYAKGDKFLDYDECMKLNLLTITDEEDEENNKQ